MAATEGENGVKGFQFRKPLNRTKLENFRRGIYDPATREFLGRTGKSWVQLLIFYSIFYLILAALFAICMQGLLATLDDKEPRWQLEKSLIGTNPGMGFRPISNRTEEGSLIWYDNRNRTTSGKWIALLDKFLESYSKENQTGKNFKSCNYSQSAPEGYVCSVDLDNFKTCSPKNYGYNTASPCVFLKLNKIFGWTPLYYTEPADEMPQVLKEAIENVTQEDRTQIWINCQGVNPIDQENLHDFDYYPSRGFPSYYFPYKNTENYLSPLIAVEIKNPKPNVIISIECRAWAKNIKYVGGELLREGSVTFEIQVDDKGGQPQQNQTEKPQQNQTERPQQNLTERTS